MGANLARRLLHEGHEVHVLMRPGFQAWRLAEIQDQIQIHLLCLHDAEAVEKTLRHIRPEWIFHLAAHGAYSWQTDLPQMIQTNLVGTVNLLQACLRTGFEAFVNTGSSSEYGIKDHPPSETDFVEPNSHYAVTKAAATLFCRHTAQKEKVPVTTLRLYSVYGPYEDPNRLVPQILKQGLRGRLPPLVEPDTVRDFVFVDDVAEAYWLAASRRGAEPGAVYNVGTGIQTSMREVVAVARRVLDIREEPAWGTMSGRQWDTCVCWQADPRAIARDLDWRPRHSFEDGLRQTQRWFQEHEARMADLDREKPLSTSRR